MRLQHLIDDLNIGTFNPVGLNILWPRNVAFLYVKLPFFLSDVEVELMPVRSLKLNTMSVLQPTELQRLTICMNSDCLLVGVGVYIFPMCCAVKTEHECRVVRICREITQAPDHMTYSSVSSALLSSWLLTTTTHIRLTNGRLYRHILLG
jgi:hypothetical protein